MYASSLGDDLGNVLLSAGPVVFYLAVWLLVFAGTALMLGIFIPFITGDTLLFASGIVVAATDSLHIAVLAIGVGIAAILGDQVGFILGARYGRGYLDRHGGRYSRKAIAAAELFYRKYGWWSVVIARFVPWGRAVVPVIAGVGRMNYYKFLSSNVVGALLWGVGLTVIGYFAASIPGVKAVAYVIAGVVIAISIVVSVHTWWVDRAERNAATPVQDPAATLLNGN